MPIFRLDKAVLPVVTSLRNTIFYLGVKSFGKPAYGIIIATFLTRLALLPLTLVATRTSKKLKSLRPAIQEITEKYRREPGQYTTVEQQNQKQVEIMEFYRREGVKPAMGCLPILFEIPVLALLEAAVKASKDDDRFTGGGILWFKDLNKPDRYFILPISLTLLEFTTHRMKTPPEGFESKLEQRLDRFAQFGILLKPFFMRRRPAGELLYMVVSAACSVVQQYFVTGWGSLFKLRF
jgi:YidC/Oxa1 family membrane protein insertase